MLAAGEPRHELGTERGMVRHVVSVRLKEELSAGVSTATEMMERNQVVHIARSQSLKFM